MLARLCTVLAVLVFALSASAFTPRTGQWWNPLEPGTGYNLDIQNGLITITTFSYVPAGADQWYLSAGGMTNNQHNFSGPLLKFVNGQCISCSYVPATLAGNDGVMTIVFSSEISATLTLPGGRVTTIQPYNFGVSLPPQGLLGEWVYVENIGGVYFADHYQFTAVGAATSTGNGIVGDVTHFAVCEQQISGTLAPNVVCIHWSDATLTTVHDQYLYLWGIDQTFSGSWISPTTFNAYPMKGHAWVSPGGFTIKASATTAAPPAGSDAVDAMQDSQRKVLAEQNAGAATQTQSNVAAALASAANELRSLLLGTR